MVATEDIINIHCIKPYMTEFSHETNFSSPKKLRKMSFYDSHFYCQFFFNDVLL